MDHVLLPKDPTSPLPRVPYLCEDDRVPYDGSDFFTYPARNGFPLLNAEENTPFYIIEANVPSDDGELESFMQSWAFFGLLHRFFDAHGLFDARDYFEPHDGDDDGGRPRYVHTRMLETRLAEWRGVALGWEPARRSREVLRLEPCFPFLRRALAALMDEVHSGCDRGVAMSLVLLAETMGRAVDVVLRPGEQRWVNFGVKIPISDEGVAQMLRNGWCHTEITWVQHEFVSNAALVYLQRLRRPDPDDWDHEACRGRDSCVYTEIDLGTYQTRHVDKHCRCGSIGPDMSKIENYLREGAFSVLKISGDSIDTVSLEVVPSHEPYVAVSHVWADGLGNPISNTLPRCQILRLRDTLNDIRGQTFLMLERDANGEEKVVDKPEERELAIWCDSLCVPTGGSESTIRAIGQLRDIYAQAAYVLILDRTLEEVHSAEIDAVEAAVRVVTSRWMRRLWTYQEGSLARKLLIRFADQVLDFRKTRPIETPPRDSDLPSAYFRSSVHSQRNSLVGFGDFSVPDGGIPLERLVAHTCYRRVSHAEDEAICLAAALNLDVAKVAAADPIRSDRRMQAMWRQMSSATGIPQTVIFADLPRLSIPGYRWAPATFQRSFHQSTIGSVFGSEKGHLTPRGFRVILPVWRVRLPGPPLIIATSFISGFSLSYSVYIRAPGGEWLTLLDLDIEGAQGGKHKTMKQLLSDRSKKWYIIREREALPDESRACRAMLAYAESTGSAQPILRSTIQLLISPANSGFVKVVQAVVPHAVSFRRSWKVFGIWILWTLGTLPWLGFSSGRGMVGYLLRAMILVGRWMIGQLSAEINDACRNVSKLPEVALAYQQDGIRADAGANWVKARLLMSTLILGDFVEVTAAFDSTKGWIID